MTTLLMTDLKRRQGGQAKAVRGATAVRPNFFPELVSIETKTNEQRVAEWRQKLNEIVEAA